MPDTASPPCVRISWFAVLVPVACLLVTLVLALSPGFFEADELTHFLIARDALHSWFSRLDIWGRPGCSNLYAILTPYGLWAPRLLAAGVTALTVLGTIRLYQALFCTGMPSVTEGGSDGVTAGGEGGRSGIKNQKSEIQNPAAWLCLLLFAQPFFLINAAAVMTEMLLACCWVWVAVAMARKRRIVAGAILGLGALARPEGLVAVAVWPVLVLVDQYVQGRGQGTTSTGGASTAFRLPSPLAVLLSVTLAALPVAAWYLLGVFLLYGTPHWHWYREGWPWAAVSPYGPSPVRFVVSCLVAVGVWMWVPIVRGVKGLPAPKTAEDQRRIGLLLFPPAALFALHGFLGVFGLFGSMALARYFVAVAPFLAILGLHGLRGMGVPPVPSLAASPEGGRRRIAVSVIVLAALPLLLLTAIGQLPIPLATDTRRIDAALAAVDTILPAKDRDARLILRHPWARYRLGLPGDSPILNRSFDRDQIAAAVPGTIVVADNVLWQYDGGPGDADFLRWGYVLDPALEARIAAVPARLDVSTIKVKAVIIHVWIKQGRP